MASAPRKHKRITPTLVAVDAADVSAPIEAPAPVAPAEAAGVVVEELEVVAKAVKQLQPLKVVMNSGYLAALLPDARILVFDHKALLCETSIAHLCEPKELLSLQLRESDPVIAASNGRVFFFHRSMAAWFSFATSSTEEELLLASLLGTKDFEAKFVNFVESREADPQHFREWPGSRKGSRGRLCSQFPSLRSLADLPNLSSSLADESLSSLWDLSKEVSQSISRLPEADRRVVGVVNFDELLWARCLFDSRAVSVEMQVDIEIPGVSFPSRVVCLAPEVDLLNHSHMGTCAPPYFDHERRKLIVKLAAQTGAGREVCLSYGPLQNWELLFYYGFCPAVNPHDRLVINVDLPDESTAEREVVLQLHGVPTEVALRPPPVEVGSGWCTLGLLPAQLLRCFRVLLGEIGSFDVDAAPGEGHMLELDLQCFAAMEELLVGLLEPLQGPEEQPSWWPIYGPRIEAFRASQRQLIEGNLQQLKELTRRFLQPNKKPRLAEQEMELQMLASFNPEHQSNLIALRRVARAPRPTLKAEDD
ncbi:unnamed protein product [Cladocopium goreaui]|uniref:SET domain-containing protein n=1 Tax=Cladocopium goreaui TaxID=2562237 RepID=A0A9P1DL91_9DINO|nr:unnamed protein product [Cladocopium goreaui]